MQPAAAQPPEAEEVVVTGSRIARRDYSSESPILTLGEDTFQQTPAVTIEATLSQLPQFIGSHNGVSAWPGTAAGQGNLNLRGLGTNRVLVLLDGRRLQPTSPNGAVDVNGLPLGLIGSIETITGGASAVYGSDAMAGVVNFKLGDLYNGGKVSYKTGITGEGDGRTNQFSVGYGTRFADDRGSAVVYVGYSDRDRMMRDARSFWPTDLNDAGGLPVLFAGPGVPQGSIPFGANAPSQAAVDAVFTQYGTASGAALATDRFGINADGTLFTSTPATRPVENYRGEQNAYSQIYQNQVMQNQAVRTDLQMGFELRSAFGKIGYDLSDNLELYTQVYSAEYDVLRGLAEIPLGGQNGAVQIPATNPFIPPDLATLLASRANPNGTFPISTALYQLPQRMEVNDYTVQQAMVGIGGSFLSRDWTWDLHASYGNNELDQHQTSISRSRIQGLLGAADGGASVCTGGYNPFGGHPISTSCADYLAESSVHRTRLDQKAVEGVLQGSAFAVPAGAVGFAVGFAYRENEYSFAAGPESGDLIGFPTAGNPSQGVQSVNEVFAEVLIPMIDSLDLGLAYRFSDYNTSGSVDTYRLSLNWRAASDLNVRGGYSRAVRAPSLAELFGAPSFSAVTIGSPVGGSTSGDPCDIRSAGRTGPNAEAVAMLCVAQGVPGVSGFIQPSASAQAVNQGNLDVAPEFADTYSIGLVWRPSSPAPLLSGLSGSIDYFDIKIADAIGVLPVAQTLASCFNYDGSNPSYSPENFYCGLVERAPGTGSLGSGATLQPLLNLTSLRTTGVDLQIDWRVHAFALNFVATYTDKLLVAPLPDAPKLNYVGTTANGSADATVVPKWKAVTTLRYDLGQGNIGVRWRYLSSVVDAQRLSVPTSTVPGAPAYNYFDLMGAWDLGRSVSLRFGVTNLADKDPPILGGTVGSTDMMTYDVLGRSYYADVTYSF